jgi:hypothetical protein
MPPAGFQLTVPASERPQSHDLDRAATGTGNSISLVANNPSIAHCRVGATNSIVKSITNRQIIFGKSDALSEQVEKNFNQEYQLHCFLEPVASVFKLEDRGNAYSKNWIYFTKIHGVNFPLTSLLL